LLARVDAPRFDAQLQLCNYVWSAPIIDVWRSKDALTWECVMPARRSAGPQPHAGAVHIQGGETEEPGKLGLATTALCRKGEIT